MMRSCFGVPFLLLAVLQLLLVLTPLASCHKESSSTTIIVVLGATGRTGSLLYQELSEQKGTTVRALVRSVDKAREILGCIKCDHTEGIYEGDITNLTSLLPVFEKAQIVAIATGVSGRGVPTPSDIRAIEFTGVQNAVRALATQGGGPLPDRQVVLCSSRGTTSPIVNSSNEVFANILHYKLNAEAFLGSVGMLTTIVKPCGLSNEEGSNRTLVALHDDGPTPTGSQMVPRADVARVMAQLVLFPPSQNLRFDLCSIEGPATSDLTQFVESAKWEWQQEEPVDELTGISASDDEKHSSKRDLKEALSRTMQSVPSRFVPAK